MERCGSTSPEGNKTSPSSGRRPGVRTHNFGNAHILSRVSFESNELDMKVVLSNSMFFGGARQSLWHVVHSGRCPGTVVS